jgi:curli production assembly/transport component CsgG
MWKITSVGIYLLLFALLIGCSPSLIEVPVEEPASLGYITSVHKELTSLPSAKEPIVAAVYKFRDQTGQYKTSASGVTWSTAVTQGATSMLLKALEDSKWFTVIEREGLSNLLNERKIIRSSRENFMNGEGEKLPPLPPLLYAGVILEGGIISYETNTVTGGIGARYFGIGTSTQYRKDEVSIYLRAVSTQTGKVLKTVYTTKSILSMSVDVNVYRYVRFKRLLEVETGYSVNEPPQMCVLEAIEKAVLSLVVEGIMDKLWTLQNPQDIKLPVIVDYLKEKDQVEGRVDYDISPNLAPRNFGIGLNGGLQQYVGDYRNANREPVIEPFFRFNFSPQFSIALDGIYGKVSNEDKFSTRLNLVELKGLWYLLPSQRISPFFMGGGGMIKYYPQDPDGKDLPVDKSKDEPAPNFVMSAVYGAGVEYFLNRAWSFHLTVANHYAFTDQLDGKIHGKLKDSFFDAKLGFTYYLVH